MREKEYLKKHYAAILSSCGLVFVIAGALMVSPLLLLPAFPGETINAGAFIFPAMILGALGVLLQRCFRLSRNVPISIQEGGVIVLISWITVILFSAWPFMSVTELPFSRAVFESMSGWTTTGLSVVDVSHAGPIILFWRSIIQLAGGAGLAIIMMSAIVGTTGAGISSAEGRSDQVAPHVRRSARLVLIIYGAYALVGTVAYRIAGMSIFDAVNHSFAAVSTGGFSTRPESIGFWDSISVELVTIVLMILGNLSFVTAYYLWTGRVRNVTRNGEVRLMSVLLPFGAAAVFFFTTGALYPHLGKSVRVAVFETVSALTTTGFSTVSYLNWNSLGIIVLILLMLVGGGTCSTAGGIKQFRIHLLWKLLVWEIRKNLLPGTAIQNRPIWEGNRYVAVDDAKVRQVTVFITLYLLTYAIGVIILCSCGYTLSDSMFEFASAVGTVGTSVGVTSAQMPCIALWAETIAMFLGRMEFMVLFLSVVKLGCDIRRILSNQ